jgi:LuxR family transcriptional regulator/LuxR family quorum-sensing system transcriptional regulator CciR
MTDRFKLADETVEKVENAETPEELKATASEYFLTHAATMVSYHHFPPVGAKDQGVIVFQSEGFPQAQIERYLEQKQYLIDPVPQYAQKTTKPFRWSRISQLTTLRPEQRALIASWARAGLGDGYAFQVFGPGGRNGVFGLGIGAGDRILSRAVIREIHWVCQAIHLKYCEMLENQAPEVAGLSNREREVLEWVARGKSNADIASIMGVSAHTVDAYLRRIFLKLGTSDRVTAAIRGVGTGLITGVV